ncbi:DUF2207 family protein [Phytohabitans aurantiacus]|uniref:Predicted membrane protein YciQ-like C-terminal domain-containing protein n=1 Tax=Phytohabitans aurantiacus TaxID=3016789 RepID=A0ABQ5R8F2_9ACTN|nr:DUF2207 domain-containing protein [Phytohabitans aurantiacus]GLI02873.1 hypothetical protein Pa4123_81510 [Phytohabitans aurantiacus]
MDSRAVLDLAVAGAALSGWFGAYGVARLLTRPASPAPDPATQDLGDESPAVVSLLVNRWSLTEDAAESTLLDLAARRFVELRQPGNDPMQTTLHLPARPPDTAGLRPYERRVLDRVRGLAVDGVVPLTALTFRDEGQAKGWNKRLHAEVVAEARAAGLSQRRFGPVLTGALTAAAVLVALVVAGAAFHYGTWSGDDDDNPGVAAGILTFFLLGAVIGVTRGERDTPLGRQVAARWLGVRDWLRGHEEFADLPPASVTVWDRYLGYGAATGATHLASAILDLGMGNRKLVWSSFGGTWHRVRVRYPRLFWRYGHSAPKLSLRAVVAGAAGVLLLFGFTGDGLDFLETQTGVAPTLDRVAVGVGAVGLLLMLYGAYTLARALVDLATVRTITGEVLWAEVWRSTAHHENRPSRPWLHYLAVDDGTDDRTTAWALPSERAGRCHDGDTVTIRVRPWSRLVVGLDVVGHGRSRALAFAEPMTTVDIDSPVEAGPARLAPEDVFTVDQIAQALGMPVRPGDPVPALGPVGSAQYVSADRGKAVLLVQSADGTAGRWAWRGNSRGEALAGIGEGAYVNGDRAALRAGETTVVLTLLGPARGRRTYLPWLLQQAAARMATRPAPPSTR